MQAEGYRRVDLQELIYIFLNLASSVSCSQKLRFRLRKKTRLAWRGCPDKLALI